MIAINMAKTIAITMNTLTERGTLATALTL